MPIYLDIDRLSHIAMVVCHGDLQDDEVRAMAEKLMAPEIVSFAKIIDNTAADMHESEEQVRWIVGMLRELAGGAQRGPVACVIDPTRTKVTRTFAELSAGDRPIKLFTSLREARRWAAEMVAESNRKR